MTWIESAWNKDVLTRLHLHRVGVLTTVDKDWVVKRIAAITLRFLTHRKVKTTNNNNNTAPLSTHLARAIVGFEQIQTKRFVLKNGDSLASNVFLRKMKEHLHRFVDTKPHLRIRLPCRCVPTAPRSLTSPFIVNFVLQKKTPPMSSFDN